MVAAPACKSGGARMSEQRRLHVIPSAARNLTHDARSAPRFPRIPRPASRIPARSAYPPFVNRNGPIASASSGDAA
jgi:hypothetical protein